MYWVDKRLIFCQYQICWQFENVLRVNNVLVWHTCGHFWIFRPLSFIRITCKLVKKMKDLFDEGSKILDNHPPSSNLTNTSSWKLLWKYTHCSITYGNNMMLYFKCSEIYSLWNFHMFPHERFFLDRNLSPPNPLQGN